MVKGAVQGYQNSRNRAGQGGRNGWRNWNVPDVEYADAQFKWEEGRVHPLYIEHVLRNILVNLPIRDLEQCKQVCKQWQSQASSVIAKRQSLIVRSNPSNSTELRQHLKEMQKTDEEIGIGSLNVVGIRIKPHFLRKFGCTLETLKLNCCSVDSTDFAFMLNRTITSLKVLHLRSIGFTNFLSRCGDYCFTRSLEGGKGYNFVLSQIKMPSLEELSIVENPKEDYNSITEIEDPRHAFLAVDIILLMTAFPNLKSLNLRCNVRPPLKNLVPKVVRKECKWLSNLTSIHIEPIKTGQRNLDMNIFQSLAFMTLNLRTVHLNPWKHRCPTLEECKATLDALTMMLRMNAGCMKDLAIMILPTSFSDETPVLPMFMPELESLALSANLVGSFDDLRYFPKLKYLELEDINAGTALSTLLDQKWAEMHPNVQTLKVAHWGLPQVGKFAKIFPNLRAMDLTFKYDDRLLYGNQGILPHTINFTVKQIAKNFPDLEYIRLSFPSRISQFTDFDILGISPDVLTSDDVPMDIIMKEKSHLGLSTFKNLKFVDFYPMSDVHDLSVQYGFSLLKQLEYVNLSTTQISPACLEFLPQRCPKLKAIKLEACARITKRHVEDLQRRMANLKILFSKDDSKLPYCERYGVHLLEDRDHDKIICNCEEARKLVD